MLAIDDLCELSIISYIHIGASMTDGNRCIRNILELWKQEKAHNIHTYMSALIRKALIKNIIYCYIYIYSFPYFFISLTNVTYEILFYYSTPQSGIMFSEFCSENLIKYI